MADHDPAAKAQICANTPAFWKAAVALSTGSFTTFTLLHSPQPILPQLAAEYALSPSVASLTMSAGTTGMAISLIPLAMMADRFGRERLMRIGVFGAALFSILCAFASDFSWLLIFRACLGAFSACVPASAIAYLGDEIAPDARGKAVGLYIAGNALGGMFGRIVAAVFTGWLGWRFSLAVLGAVGLIGALMFVRLLPRARFFTPSNLRWSSLFDELKRVYADRTLPWLFVVAFLLMGSFVAMYNYLGFRLSEAPYDLAPSAVGSVFLLYAIGSVASAKSGELADRHGYQRIGVIFAALMAIGLGITIFEPLSLVVGGLAIFTVGYFGVFTVGNAWVGLLAGQRKATVSALFFSSAYLGSGALGSGVGVPWATWHWPGVVVALTVAILLITCIFAFLKKGM